MYFLLEASVSNQELVHCFLGRFDEGLDHMEGAVAPLFTATHHACIFYAPSQTKEEHSEGWVTSLKVTVQIW